MLVISSNTYPVYVEHRKVWKRYMHSNPNIDCFFVQFSPLLRFQSHTFDGDTLTFPGVERYETIYRKTLLALNYFMNRKAYDYVVRTNLSAVWDFGELLAYLETAPRSGFYAGPNDPRPGFSFVTGSGILWSADVAQMLVRNPGPSPDWTVANDDVVIGYWLHQLGITPVYERPWVQFNSLDDYETNHQTIPPGTFQFRLKHKDNIHSRMDEPIMMNRLLEEHILTRPL